MDKFPAVELRTSTRTARPAAALWARRLSESPRRVDLAINPRQVLYTLIAIIAALALASTAAGAALYFFAWPEESFGYEIVKLFWLDTEHNIPTPYQCTALFGASALFVLLGRRHRRAQLGCG